MGEFFLGWRRRFGFVTLVMALVLLGGWVRSFGSYDSIRLNCSLGQFAISSGWGELHFVLAPYAKGMQFILLGSNNTTTKEDAFPWNKADTIWQWERAGFHLRNVSFQNESYWFCFVPYWSIAIPMTLVSAFLLLSKPSQSTPKKITDFIPEKVG